MPSNNLTKIVFIALLVSFLFMLVTGIYGVKSNNLESCGSEKIIYSSSSSDTEYTNLATSSLSLLSRVDYDQERIINYLFCVRGNASKDLNLLIVDESNNSLGKIFFPEGRSTHCDYIKNISSYVGVTCLNCNSTHNLTIYQSIGTNLESTYLTTDFKNTFNLLQDNNPLSFNLYAFKDCSHVVKKFTVYYISIIGVLLLLFLILLGANSFDKNLIGIFGGDNF